MILLIIGVITTLISGGLGKGIRDTLAHHFEQSIFSKLNPKFWNPVLSGNNKWKGGDKKNGEKFFQSSNLLVALTEGWHIAETINVNFLILGCSILVFKLGLIYGLILTRLLYGVSFYFCYKFFKKKGK